MQHNMMQAVEAIQYTYTDRNKSNHYGPYYPVSYKIP